MPAKSQAQRAMLNAKFGHDWVKRHHFDNKGKLPKHKTQETMIARVLEVLLQPSTRPMGTTDDECWDNYLAAREAGELQSQQPGFVPPEPMQTKLKMPPFPKHGFTPHREVDPDSPWDVDIKLYRKAKERLARTVTDVLLGNYR